eukprot:1142139-Pelagomonas_calceolata.AAC.6
MVQALLHARSSPVCSLNLNAYLQAPQEVHVQVLLAHRAEHAVPVTDADIDQHVGIAGRCTAQVLEAHAWHILLPACRAPA